MKLNLIKLFPNLICREGSGIIIGEKQPAWSACSELQISVTIVTARFIRANKRLFVNTYLRWNGCSTQGRHTQQNYRHPTEEIRQDDKRHSPCHRLVALHFRWPIHIQIDTPDLVKPQEKQRGRSCLKCPRVRWIYINPNPQHFDEPRNPVHTASASKFSHKIACKCWEKFFLHPVWTPHLRYLLIACVYILQSSVCPLRMPARPCL